MGGVLSTLPGSFSFTGSRSTRWYQWNWELQLFSPKPMTVLSCKHWTPGVASRKLCKHFSEHRPSPELWHLLRLNNIQYIQIFSFFWWYVKTPGRCLTVKLYRNDWQKLASYNVCLENQGQVQHVIFVSKWECCWHCADSWLFPRPNLRIKSTFPEYKMRAIIRWSCRKNLQVALPSPSLPHSQSSQLYLWASAAALETCQGYATPL